MDKKLLTAILALIAATGRMNDLAYTPRDTEPMLVMNSLMTAGDASHEVWLGLSRPGTVDTLKGAASVRYSINGSAYAAAVEQEGRQRLRRFVFAGPLSPGDRVRLEAASGSYGASAEVTVPSLPVLGDIDTLSVGDSAARQLAFRIRMTDKTPGADYYSLGIICNSQIEFFKTGASVGTAEFSRLCPLDTGEDLVLSEENIAAANMDSMFDIGTPNRFGAFFDSQFDCASVVLKPKVNKWELRSWYVETFLDYDSVYVKPVLRVDLSHIDVRHYYYLKALNSLESGTSDLVLEEIAIPDNVDGGIGFVGISNTVSRELPLEPYGRPARYYEDESDELPGT